MCSSDLQGDEPLIDPALVRTVADNLATSSDCVMATVCCPIASASEFTSTAAVKVVLDNAGRALYFSRAPIPWARDAFASGIIDPPAGLPARRHIGLYAYRAVFLHTYTTLAPSPIEQWEALEQLRVLWHGFRISVAITPVAPPAGVDRKSHV